MAIERTLSIIKPDAVSKNVIGEIYSRFEKAGLKVVAAKMLQLNDESAGGFYAEHKERPFYPDLIEFMTSGPVMVQVLEGENAVALNRELMGSTNPAEAAPGTIRADFAKSILTTDTRTKQIAVTFKVGGATVTMGGVSKGAGMIHPNMATMLGILTCDAAVAPDAWQEMVRAACDSSFNQS